VRKEYGQLTISVIALNAPNEGALEADIHVQTSARLYFKLYESRPSNLWGHVSLCSWSN
jgi:hypothetical protein